MGVSAQPLFVQQTSATSVQHCTDGFEVRKKGASQNQGRQNVRLFGMISRVHFHVHYTVPNEPCLLDITNPRMDFVELSESAKVCTTRSNESTGDEKRSFEEKTEG
jgi:hypothetical protein